MQIKTAKKATHIHIADTTLGFLLLFFFFADADSAASTDAPSFVAGAGGGVGVSRGISSRCDSSSPSCGSWSYGYSPSSSAGNNLLATPLASISLPVFFSGTGEPTNHLFPLVCLSSIPFSPLPSLRLPNGGSQGFLASALPLPFSFSSVLPLFRSPAFDDPVVAVG